MGIVNTIEYDVKSYQVKTNIVNFTYVRLKVFKIVTSHKTKCWYSQHDGDSNNKILNDMRSLKCNWCTFFLL